MDSLGRTTIAIRQGEQGESESEKCRGTQMESGKIDLNLEDTSRTMRVLNGDQGHKDTLISVPAK